MHNFGFCTIQFEDEFLARVRAWTSVNLLTATGLVIYLFMQIFQWQTKTSSCKKIDTGLCIKDYETSVNLLTDTGLELEFE